MSEFSRLVDIRSLPAAPIRLEAEPAECAALARRFDIVAIHDFEATVALEKDGAAIDATGRLAARLVQSCAVSGEMLVSAAGRVARAWVAESRGVYRPQWTIEDVAANAEAIRDTSAPEHFTPVPDGQLDHLLYSFAMARGG